MSGPVTILGADGRNNAPDNPVYVTTVNSSGEEGDTVTISPSSTVYCGTLSANTTAQSLGSQAVSEVLVQNDPSSTVNVLVGSQTTQAVVLQPGSYISLMVANVNLIYVKSASSTASVHWIARS